MGATVPDGNGMLKWQQVDGMTLREYYAGQAIIGLAADPNMAACDRTVDLAVRLADALIAALQES